MDLNLKGKVVLITGGAGKKGSIGEAMVQALAEEGALPAIIDRNARGFEYAAELQSRNVNALFAQADVTDPEQVERAVGQAVQHYGRVDALVNNVGVNDGVGLDATYEQFMQSLRLNLASYFLAAKYALPALKASKGSILNIGSKVSLTGQGGTSGYAAAKGGVLALTREWALGLIRYEIRVNCLVVAECWTPAYEAWIDTLEDGPQKLQRIREKIPLQNRMTTPREIADTALFLISGRASHTTGQFVFADGGYVHLDRAML